MSLGDEPGSGGYGGTGQTRTRLPDGPADPRRSGRTSPRSLITVVGVVVLLIAAIAFANRGDGDSAARSGAENKPRTSTTAALGQKPPETTSNGIPTGFPHTQEGAQSAAANYAVALGSADMFTKSKRDSILQTIMVPSRVAHYETQLDQAYTAQFNKNVGLNEDGSTPSGYTFVSRTSPIGTKVTDSSADRATVEVWSGGLLGLAGENSTNPVTNSWFTITMRLEWADGDWKIEQHAQKDGPAPVPGDSKASSADDMAKAVEEYGGFTYAR
ncbi:hypothetical protein [Streptomyces sp. ACT015]|uniref:hypothetical protein n=1 Tax=Streptomyces sp. ACT015 TaxID=3134807 RepID=UPI003D17D3E7